MNSVDKEKFTQGLMILAEVYNRKLSTLLLQTYWNCLKSYPLIAFEKALAYFLKNPTYVNKGFPSPAEWVKAIEGDNEVKSLIAWTLVVKTIRSIGQYDSVDFRDPIIHVVINEMGGWVFLCRQSERELVFLQKEFERRYRHYCSMKKVEFVRPSHLMGRIEHQNAVQGFTDDIPEPVVVSSEQKESMTVL